MTASSSHIRLTTLVTGIILTLVFRHRVTKSPARPKTPAAAGPLKRGSAETAHHAGLYRPIFSICVAIRYLVALTSVDANGDLLKHFGFPHAAPRARDLGATQRLARWQPLSAGPACGGRHVQAALPHPSALRARPQNASTGPSTVAPSTAPEAASDAQQPQPLSMARTAPQRRVPRLFQRSVN